MRQDGIKVDQLAWEEQVCSEAATKRLAPDVAACVPSEIRTLGAQASRRRTGGFAAYLILNAAL